MSLSAIQVVDGKAILAKLLICQSNEMRMVRKEQHLCPAAEV